MAYLLDVNLLIAISDRDHVHHNVSKKWFKENSPNGWATCPITENGFVRVISNPKYPGNPGPPSKVIPLLNALISVPGHQFWADDISIVADNPIELTDETSSNSITDLYLLALASNSKGKLATLDQRIDYSLVKGGAKALEIIRG